MLAPTNKAAAPTLMQRLVGLVAPTPRAKPFSEMGVSGTPVCGGYVQTREKSSAWTGAQRYITIADMAVNASIVAAGVHYFLNLIARPSWTAQPADESAKAKELAEFVDEVLHDMRRPWPRVVRRAGTYRFFGFGVQEWTAKRRPDGKIGLASVEPRPQHTIERWALGKSGAIEGVFQRDPSTGTELGIPRGKIMYLVEDAISDSPEGVGIFRHLAEPWERLKVYMELEARAFERDLRGIPVGRVPYTLLNEAVKAGNVTAAEAASMTRMLEDFVQLQVRQSNTAITLDSVPYYSQAADGSKVAGIPQWGLELLQGAAQGVEAIAAAITRTQMEMARILTCEHLLMGAEGSGNRSLAEDKSRNLYLVANAVLADIAEAATHDLVEPLWALNAFPEELKPRLEAEDVAFQDADTVASTLAKMAQAGAVLAPDDPVIADVRALMGVSPPAPISPELVGIKAPEDDEDGEVKDEPSADADDVEIEEGGLEKAFDPNRPRHPAGGPEGGRWAAAGEAVGEGEAAKKRGAYNTLYVKRRLLNPGALRAWAASQGIASTLLPGDMHVTVAFSREPVDWSRLELYPDAWVEEDDLSKRAVHQFPPRSTPNGALVLKFESPELRARWQHFRDMGASWDFPEYQPHVIITYSVPEADVAGIEPYRGPLIFGPEEAAEVDNNWAGAISEEPTRGDD